jgi:hypothetical protein
LTFQGSFTGTLSATTASLSATVDQPNGQFLSLGGHVFGVNLTVTPPGSPASGTLGLIQAQVAFSGSPPPVSQPSPSGSGTVPPPPPQMVPASTALSSPEPSNLVLASLGLILLGCASLRFSKRNHAA